MSDIRGLSPQERALRERGAELVLRITAILRVARAYSVTNQVFRNQLEAHFVNPSSAPDHCPPGISVVLAGRAERPSGIHLHLAARPPRPLED